MSRFQVGDWVGKYKVFSVREDGHDFSPRGIHVQAVNPRDTNDRLRFSQGGVFNDRDDEMEPGE